jgi:hypothetical protein
MGDDGIQSRRAKRPCRQYREATSVNDATDLTAAEAALAARDDLSNFANSARALFGLQMEFGIEDLASIAGDVVVDGPDDKSVDVVYVDDRTGRAIVAQDYEATAEKDAAPANKAASLGQGAQWLLARPIDQVPERLRSAASLVRQGIADGTVTDVDVWYVHNCPESNNVGDELQAARATLSAIVVDSFPDAVLNCGYRELGRETFAEMYRATQVAIEVAETFELPADGSFESSGDQWSAVCLSIPGQWLVDRFNEHGESLFSANVRGYLGSRRSDRNINNGIQETADETPGEFWVFNNGITGLVNDFDVESSQDGAQTLTISGLAIVNGAQTTGSLASSKADLADVTVMARFVKCSNPDVVRSIIRFNNRQNKVEAVDFRSNDAVQSRLRDEFNELGGMSYSGGRRGGVEDVIRRPGDSEIPASTASQSLAAFHGDPNLAYNRKSDIWENDAAYGRHFRDDLTAKHMFFAFSLLRSIEANKQRLRDIPEGQRTDAQKRQLTFLSKRGATYLTVAAIANSLESVLGKSVASRFDLSFNEAMSLSDAVSAWDPVVRIATSLSSSLVAGTEQGLKNTDNVQQVLTDFQGQLDAVREPSAETFDAFGDLVLTGDEKD